MFIQLLSCTHMYIHQPTRTHINPMHMMGTLTDDPLAPDWTINWRELLGKRLCSPEGTQALQNKTNKLNNVKYYTSYTTISKLEKAQ